jgi:ribosomal protein L15
MFDLKKNNLSDKAEAGYEFEVVIPETFEATGFFVTVRGEQSPVVKAYGRRKFQEYQQREQIAKRKGKEVDQMTLDEAEELAVESAVIRVISWRGLAEDGQEIKFSKEEAERVLTEHAWIREQILENSGNLRNFLA